MPQADLQGHLANFCGYVKSLRLERQREEDAIEAVLHSLTVLGLVQSTSFEENPDAWAALFRIADRFDGLVFAYNSLILPNGGIVFGDLLESD